MKKQSDDQRELNAVVDLVNLILTNSNLVRARELVLLFLGFRKLRRLGSRWVSDGRFYPEPNPLQLSVEQATEIQERILFLLTPLLDLKAPILSSAVLKKLDHTSPGGEFQTRTIDAPRVSFSLIPPSDSGTGYTLTRVGSCSDCSAMKLMQLLEMGYGDLIRQCRCGKIFVRLGKRKYCSTKCTNAEGVKRWRSKLKNRAKESEWAKLRYKKNFRKKN